MRKGHKWRNEPNVEEAKMTRKLEAREIQEKKNTDMIARNEN